MIKRILSPLTRLFRSLENPSVPFSQWRIGPNVSAGVEMDESTALSHLPVFSAVNRISSDMALLSPQIVERQNDGTMTPVLDHPAEQILSVSPNGEISADRWRQAGWAHVLTYGNWYNEIEYDEAWQVKAVHMLDPAKMRVHRLDDDTIVYEYRSASAGPVPLPPWKVLHFAGLGYDGLVGYSPITLARETLGLGKAADIFGASFFGHSARPAGMLKTTKTLSDTAARRLRSDFENLYAGAYNTGRVIVGEDGMDFVPISISPDDAQFLETRKMGVEDVARLYNIPAHKIGGATPAGDVESQNIDYMQSTLLGLCNMFEGEIKLKLLNGPEDRRRHATHDFKKLLKANATARAQYNATAIQWGWATRNRVAQDEGYAPYKGGEAPLLPLNMVQIGPDGIPLPNPLPPQPATPTTSATPSSATEIAGIVRALTRRRRRSRGASREARAAVLSVAKAELSRALRRELAAATRAAGKTGFREAVLGLCSDHRAYLIEALGPACKALAAVGVAADPVSFADAWAEQSKADLLAVEAVTTSDQRPDAVAELGKRWERRIDTAWAKNDAT